MAKRMTKAEANGYLALAIIGLPFYLLYRLIEMIGWPGFIGACALLIFCAVWYSKAKTKTQRLEAQREEEHRQPSDIVSLNVSDQRMTSIETSAQ